MHENRAAAASDTRAGVVVELDDEGVKMVLTPQRVAGGASQQAGWPVVAPVGRVLAPRIVRRDAAHRQEGARPRGTVGPPPQLAEPETAVRCCPVALALVGLDA